MSVGFSPDEVRTAEPTRSARLKWVVVVNSDLGAGAATNAVACAAAATGCGVAGLLGADGVDAGGATHLGLPWAGCSVLGAPGETLTALRERFAGYPDVHLVDMPVLAQQTRVYDEYLEALAATEPGQVQYAAVSAVGPRNRMAKLTKGLDLLA